MSYVVLIVFNAPTPWQNASEAVYGPFATHEEADSLIHVALVAGAIRIAVFPLNSSHTSPMEIR